MRGVPSVAMSLHQLLQLIEHHPVRPSDGGAFEQEGNVLRKVLEKSFKESFWNIFLRKVLRKSFERLS